MLKLTDSQYQQFLAGDTRNFIAAVADQFLAKRPEMQANPGRAEVIERMQNAYNGGLKMGFTSTPHLVYMMYMEADAPGLFEDETVRYYLTKPTSTPEQRLDDFDAILKLEIKRMGEK
ncbi:hypothetical protein ACTOWA_04855 [Herbaspirillum seropedicae]|uniref:hypothetical protein n=1 Tax=Herbaspirillum seropedicae TaxID=964 RepID=UPI00285B87CD|nr:hypothetical protein [Herbaspirillum seropedicae]MDR6397276.1 hypothetical protein [Herbaspirillum seropedicae]